MALHLEGKAKSLGLAKEPTGTLQSPISLLRPSANLGGCWPHTQINRLCQPEIY